MKPELISKLNDSFKVSLDVAAALSFSGCSELGYWMLRARGLDCRRSYRALFGVLVDLLEVEAGRHYAERLAGLILAEALHPRRCKSCFGSGEMQRGAEAGFISMQCPSCGGLGFHWLGERQIAELLGLSRHQVRRGQVADTVRSWAAWLIVLEAETAKNAVLD